MKVIAPYSAADAKGLLKAAIRDPNPVMLPGKRNPLWQDLPGAQAGRFRAAHRQGAHLRPGKDVTIVAYSITVGQALEAAEKLAEDGIDAEVIDLRSLRPLDMDTVLESVKKTNRIVTFEQAWPVCSIGSEVCSRVALEAFDYLDAPPTKVSGKDVPMPYAANLEKLALPTVDDLIEAVKAVMLQGLSTMATNILMPALSPTMEEGKLAKWLVKEGDTVKSGTILAEIETDKATMEFEAVDEGKIGKILVPEGSEGVKVNAPIAVLLDEGEKMGDAPAAAPAAAKQDIPAAMKDIGDAVKKEVAPQGRSAGTAAPARPLPKADGVRIFASPLARRIAAQKGLDTVGASPAPARAAASSNRMSRMPSQARRNRLLLARRLPPVAPVSPAWRRCPMRGCSIRRAPMRRPRTTICARPSPSASHRPRR